MSGSQFEGAGGRGRGRGRGDESLAHRGRGRGRGGSLFQSPPPGPQDSQGGRGRGGRGGFGRGRGGLMEKEVFTHGAGDVPQQDIQVQKIENEIERASQPKKGPGPKKPPIDPRLPQRPGYGTRGKSIMLWANYFELVTRGDLLLFRYSVEILADEAGRRPTGKRAKRIVELLLEEHFPQHMNSIATDYKSNLICRSELPTDEDPYLVRYRSEDEDDPPQNAKTYRIRLQDTGTFRVSELMDYLTSTHASALFGSKEEIIQALNIVMGHYSKTASRIASVGANKHFEMSAATSERMPLGAGLQAVRGFFVSVRAATARILINVQVKSAAFYNEGPLGQLIDEYFREHGRNNMMKLGNFLKRIRILVTHIVRTNRAGHAIPRIKTIVGLAMPGDGQGLQHRPIVPQIGAGPKDVKFFIGSPDEPDSPQEEKGKKGKKPAREGPKPPQDDYVSVYDFFQSRHNITCKDPSMPVVNVGTRQNPSYLPVDVCQVLPGQPSGTKLSPSQTQQMIRFAVRKPAQNARSIVVGGARVLGIQPPTNNVLHDFDIAVTPRLIAVPGRVLTGPDVKYKNDVANARFGSWNMQLDPRSRDDRSGSGKGDVKSLQFSTSGELASWTYLWISTQGFRDAWSNEQQLQTTMNTFQSKLRALGIIAANYTPGLRITLTGADNDELIDRTIHRFANSPTRPPPGLLLVILPYVDDPIYNRVKWACDVKEGLLNVCVLGSKFAKDRNDQYFANVALKVNLKLGARNQFLNPSKTGLLAQGKTMVVGIDVTHPSPGSASNAPSVAGIVASVDRWLAQWPADLRIQTARQEMVSDLDSLLASRLRLWALRNDGKYPENILIYRDGVSEGQYDAVLEQEVPLIRKACKTMYSAQDTKTGLPRLSLIVVGKRHNTRFFATRTDDADRSSNPPNGTVVDRGVTESLNWDFYLQAHAAIQGTARPAHYYVVLDDIFRFRPPAPPAQNPADALEDLTHNLCYLFGRATKAVSVCPPAYYADLVCERARRYLSRLFDATPGATPAGSVAAGGGAGAQQALGADETDVRIHARVRDSMFYI